jgi:phosphate transport system permease protein
MITRMTWKRRLGAKTAETVFFVNGLAVVCVLIGIFVLLVKTALPVFKDVPLQDFLFGIEWNPSGYHKQTYGIVAMLTSTCMVTLGALFLAVPLGIGAAAFLSDVAPQRVREVAKPIVEVLAGIPSVVIGFLGIVLVGPFLAKLFHTPNGLNAVNGSVLLAVMALPTIISLSEDALAAVPESYEQASLALGATKWQMLITVKIPAASSGIIAACMLGMGRAIGETMTVLMATGCASAMPGSFLDSVRTMTATVAIELGEVAYGETHYYGLFAIGLVLFVITFIVNMIADTVLHRYEQKAGL